eukprot:scaffold9079_cov120-Cylindrotheca_fusiformis.AAC.16
MMRSLPASEAVMKNIKMADSARGKDNHQPSSKQNNLRLETEIALLRRQLLQATVENARKESVIESLQNRLNEAGPSKPQVKRHKSLGAGVSVGKQSPDEDVSSSSVEGKKVRDMVNKIQRWLFVEGGTFRDMQSLLSEYCELCQSLGIPLDRLVAAGLMVHPYTTSCVWKWEKNCDFSQEMVAPEAFQPPAYNPDEPFAVLMEGKALEYRMNVNTKKIPPGCAWFREGEFKDFYALPLYHNGKFKGAMAWATKSGNGFSDDHCEILKKSLTAFSTVLRLYANDLFIEEAMMRLEESVQSQTQQLETANSNLEHANRMIVEQSQKQLKHFAMMSHEIRTPLNCIVGISNLMMDMCDDETMKESLEMITSSGDLLLAVVDDVLDYSKLAAGKVETRIEPTNLSFTVKTVETSIRTKAKANNLEVRTKISPDIPECLDTDGRRLQQILYNLLGNAVKFGSEGEHVDFTVELEPNESDGDYVRFSIKDYGKGIAPNEMGNIFEPFRQLASNEPRHGGTGLGLAITRQLVKALGGTVSVQSEYGHWCEFSFSLPCEFRPNTKEDEVELPTIHHHQQQQHHDLNSSRRLSDASVSTGYDFSDSETCASLDASFVSYGGASTTSFQQVVDAAARQQVANMAGSQISGPLIDSGSVNSSSNMGCGSSSMGSQSSFGLGSINSRSGSHTSLSNKQFGSSMPRPRSYGSVRRSGSLGSFGGGKLLARRIRDVDSSSLRNKQFSTTSDTTTTTTSVEMMRKQHHRRRRSTTSVPNAILKSFSGGSGFANSLNNIDIDESTTLEMPNGGGTTTASNKPRPRQKKNMIHHTTTTTTSRNTITATTKNPMSPRCNKQRNQTIRHLSPKSNRRLSPATRPIRPISRPISPKKSTTSKPRPPSSSSLAMMAESKLKTTKSATSTPTPTTTCGVGASASTTTTTTTTTAKKLSDLHVLIAEDNAINQKVLKRTLERLGIEEIEIVDNGKLAVDRSETKMFDIIFMDMQMPIMDGLEATSVISQRHVHPKIFFLTAHALSEYQEKALEAGGDGFISKPFKLDVIRNILNGLLVVLEDDDDDNGGDDDDGVLLPELSLSSSPPRLEDIAVAVGSSSTIDEDDDEDEEEI